MVLLNVAGRGVGYVFGIILNGVLYLIQITLACLNGILNYFKPLEKEEIILLKALTQAKTYDNWLVIAEELDNMNNMGVWKKRVESKLYDYKLISSRIQSLRAAKLAEDIPTMKLLIRSGLLRNLGGICDSKLFSKTFVGTKNLIDEYLAEVVNVINVINAHEDEPIVRKIELFSEVRQSFGNTALLLHGGTTFGLFHLGVVKALFQEKLLPTVISGSSVGALIAALVCTHKDEDIPSLFVENGIDLKAFSNKKKGSISRKITRLLTKGYLLDVKVLEDCVEDNLGDITFQEAFTLTGKVLNIIVSSGSKDSKTNIPQIFNYITTPNVLIRSAACGAASIYGLLSRVELLAKDEENKLFVWSPSTIQWDVSYSNMESPEQRLAELFNVNQFILSQSQPYTAPFLSHGPSVNSSRWLSKVKSFVTSEITFRLEQLAKLGIIPARVDFTVKSNVTIAPKLESLDFYTIFSNPTYESLNYWILKGEQSTWPKLGMIRNRLLIEMKLAEIEKELKGVREETYSLISTNFGLKQRTQSFG